MNMSALSFGLRDSNRFRSPCTFGTRLYTGFSRVHSPFSFHNMNSKRFCGVYDFLLYSFSMVLSIGYYNFFDKTGRKSEKSVKRTVCTVWQQRPFCMYAGYLFFFLRFPKMLSRNRSTFITAKNPTRIPKVTPGRTGARLASSISGNPNTMAGKF